MGSVSSSFGQHPVRALKENRAWRTLAEQLERSPRSCGLEANQGDGCMAAGLELWDPST